MCLPWRDPAAWLAAGITPVTNITHSHAERSQRHPSADGIRTRAGGGRAGAPQRAYSPSISRMKSTCEPTSP